MPEGLVLKSGSFEPGGEEARQKNLETVIKKAGFEIEKPETEAELPAPPAELHETLSPKEAFEKNVNAYGVQIEKAKEAHKDWGELQKKFEANDVFIGPAVQQTILEQSNGAEVTYYLMKNPAYAAKLGKMCKAGRGVSAVREIENLSARLGGNTTHASYTPRRTSATPRQPVRPSANASFAEIAAMPSYQGKARDLKRAQRR
jgi:hypothetical protein